MNNSSQPPLIGRLAAPLVRDALAAAPVVLLQGPRQCGKSTIARMLVEEGRLDRYLTLDDIEPLEAAKRTPDDFVAGIADRVVIDEIQRAPELLRAIKARVDRDRTPGRFLLTASANVLLLPRLSETLAGRMRIVDLWPFAQTEIQSVSSGFISACFSDEPMSPAIMPESRAALMQHILGGGYPPALATSTPAQRADWFASHARTLATRTVPDIVRIEGLLELPRLMRMLATRTGTLLNAADIARGVGLPQTTLKRYLAVLQAAFVLQLVPAWTAESGRRLIRTPKLLFTDTGFASSLMQLDADRLEIEPALTGQLVETFAAMELVKLATWSHPRVALHHFRSAAGHEVDLVLEGPAGRLVGVEVKSAIRGSGDDARGLRALAESSGSRFHRGVVLYAGDEVRPLGKNMDLVPMSALWTAQA